jgi:hypothetical protein
MSQRLFVGMIAATQVVAEPTERACKDCYHKRSHNPQKHVVVRDLKPTKAKRGQNSGENTPKTCPKALKMEVQVIHSTA